jgi:hypothetical protein
MLEYLKQRDEIAEQFKILQAAYKHFVEVQQQTTFAYEKQLHMLRKMIYDVCSACDRSFFSKAALWGSLCGSECTKFATGQAFVSPVVVLS